MTDDRKEFLVEMYRQMFNDINRNINVVWQSVGVVVGAFAIFALVEKKILSSDLASTIIILLCTWLFAHVVDSAYWYNRNLAIIANIERQFLVPSDLKEIHYYFGRHRPKNKMIKQLQIQAALGIGLGLIIIIYHFTTRLVPGFSSSWRYLELSRGLPYFTVLLSVAYGFHLLRDRREAYDAFLRESPGITIDTSSVNYGVGHGYGPSWWRNLRSGMRKTGA